MLKVQDLQYITGKTNVTALLLQVQVSINIKRKRIEMK